MKQKTLTSTAQRIDEIVSARTDTLPFASTGFSSLPLDSSQFIVPPLFGSSQRLIGIDGGMACLLDVPGLCVYSLRVASAVYDGKKMVDHTISTHLCIISANETGFAAEIIDGSTYSFDETVEELNGEKRILDVHHIASTLRRRFEIEMALSVGQIEDVIAMDGSSEARSPEELVLLTSLVRKRSVLFVSKTSKLLTKSGNALSVQLLEMGPKSTWHYPSLFSSQPPRFVGTIGFARLHPRSDRIVRLDLVHGITIDPLISYSNDPVMLGYPYPLITADRLARISHEESSSLRTQLLASMQSSDRLRRLLLGVDAHSILDTIR